jgi:hypothetical protein
MALHQHVSLRSKHQLKWLYKFRATNFSQLHLVGKASRFFIGYRKDPIQIQYVANKNVDQHGKIPSLGYTLLDRWDLSDSEFIRAR